jgi:RNA polymerase sigma factor (sigma-70 family)
MTADEWEDLTNLLAVVQMAAYDVCEFIDGHMKSEIEDRLCQAGVPNYVEDAYHDVQVNVRRNMCQLEEIDLFEPWLVRISMSTAKKYRPRMLPNSKPFKKQKSKAAEKPLEIGSKTITIDGKPHIVRVFEPNPAQDQITTRTPLFEPCSSSAIANWSKTNCQDYPRKIDVRKALAKLNKRWAKALLLVYVEERTAAEAAEILDCTIPRVYRLVQFGKNRLRELLPGYGRTGKAKTESRSSKARRRARTKRPLGISDVLPHGCPIHVTAPLSTGFRCR